MRFILTLLTCFIMVSCTKKEDSHKETIEVKPQTIKKVLLLKTFSYEDVAKYTISTVMGQSPDIMSANKKDDVYIVSYVRKSDSQRFTYKVKFSGNNTIWANIDGRWRDGQYDELIRFEESGEILKIYTNYSDGSSEMKEFKK